MPAFLSHVLCALLLAWVEVVAGTIKWCISALLGPKQQKGQANGFFGQALGTYAPRYRTQLKYKKGGTLEYEIDQEASLATANFPIPPQKLIENAKVLIKADFGVLV